MIIFDLDGTLALDAHRSHHLKKTPKDWATYFSLCGDDEPNHPIIKILKLLHGTEKIVLFSGRSMEVWDETAIWLAKHNIYDLFDVIRLRPVGDHTDDVEMKRAWLHEEEAKGEKATLVFEDRQRVVDMWREEGLVCCQVAPGDF